MKIDQRPYKLEQHGCSVQSLLQDVERRLLNAMLNGGMSNEIKRECGWKLQRAIEDINKLPDKRRNED